MVGLDAGRGGERALKGWLPAPWAKRAGAALGFKKGCPVRPSKGPVVLGWGLPRAQMGHFLQDRGPGGWGPVECETYMSKGPMTVRM